MEFWIIFDRETGAIVERGSGSTGVAAAQELDASLGMILVPQAVVRTREIDLDVLRAYLAASIDAQAEQVRQQFLTPGAGQGMTYIRKEMEARAWVADGEAATPFLTVEAAARGMTVADLAAEVIQLADAWVVIGSTIEGLRMGAKTTIARSVTFGDVVLASEVDWGKVGQAAAAIANG